MSLVDTMINTISEIGPGWLLVMVLAGLALVMLLPSMSTWFGRRKQQQEDPTVTAKTALQQGRYEEAEAMYLALLKKAREEFGPEDPKVVRPMRNLAMLYHLQGKNTAAEPLLHGALVIMDKADPDNIENSVVLEQLAEVREAQGRYEAAELILLRSLAIREKALGPDHPHVMPVLQHIATLYKKLGKKDEAKVFEERAKKGALPRSA